MAVIGTGSMFAEGVKAMGEGRITFTAGATNIYAALMKKSFVNTTFDETARDQWNFFASIPDADQAGGTNHIAVGTPDTVIDAANDNVNFAPSTVTIVFPTVTNLDRCRGIVVFKSSGAAEATSPNIAYCHFTTGVTADGGSVTVTLHANGLFRQSYD